MNCFLELKYFVDRLSEGESSEFHGNPLILNKGILRTTQIFSEAQKQTKETFGYKWNKRETFETGLPARMRYWLTEKFGDIVNEDWFLQYGKNPVIMDAGCGAALSSLALFEDALDRIHYIGVDISTAVDVAKARFHERNSNAVFIQSDLNTIPLPEKSVDMIFSEGVLHHTDNTKDALKALLPFLKEGGRIIFYVYRKKGPVREFTDDYIREELQKMSPQEAWDAILPLTKLGVALGTLDVEVNVPEAVDILGIPAGPINIQRLFYWHVFKAMYRTDISFDEMQHINFDWYAPKNAHRHTIEEVRSWCEEFNLSIEREKVEMAGISIIAQKLGEK